MARSIRLFRDEPLTADGVLELDAQAAHYLTGVLRRPAGAELAVFNAEDGEWLGRVEQAGRRGASVRIERQLRAAAPEAGPELWFAPIKRAKLELVVEKATELGVGTLRPLSTEHAVVDRINGERLRAIAIEAAEQSGRLSVPLILPLGPLDLALAEDDLSRPLHVLDPADNDRSLSDSLETFGAGPLLIGPEGGFAPAELALMRSRPNLHLVSLGPRILRAETAAIAALACWQASVGDAR